MNCVEVVAALIRDGERFLICRRLRNKARGLLWEFPGGKVEPGETKEQALVREGREELDVTLSVGAPFAEAEYEYPDIRIHLTLFEAAVASGTLTLLEHEEMRFILPEEIGAYSFCPADRGILDEIAARRPDKRG